MQTIYLHDKVEIEGFLRKAPFVHLYELGDLDDFFWPYTSWIAGVENREMEAVILVYSGGGLPVVLALGEAERAAAQELVYRAANQPLLPRRFYAHLSPGLESGLAQAGYRLEAHGRYLKMGLLHPEKLLEYSQSRPPNPAIRRLTVGDRETLQAMYGEAYPGNWFDARMVETGCYFGVWQDGALVSAGGIHVYSPRYKAAALGNICTRPEARGRGWAGAVTAQVCLDMLPKIETIGLNVRADNAAAQAVYRRLGFEVVAEYNEFMAAAG